MKKIVALLLSLVMVLSMVACGGKDTAKSDLEKVKENGKLVVGITEFAPMDYKDKDGNEVIEDSKGMRTKEYILKKKMMRAYLGITIKEV